MALAAENVEQSATDPAATKPAEKEPEEIVGSVQEDLESTSTPSKEAVTESSLPPAAVEETIAARPASPSEPVAKEQVAATPVVEDPVVEEPIVKEPKAEAPVAERQSPEYDKTTTTSLQEEADPEVLRAKQAATAQFSGTANLGQSRDLGTTGNNAMDQAVNNPANTAASEKKPSGGWFIWVFIALIIIGIALWLFNMGGA